MSSDLHPSQLDSTRPSNVDRGGRSAQGPRHHFDDEHLLDFVAGTAPSDVSLPVALHLALCQSCQHRTTDLESVATSILASATLPHPGALRREQLLASLGSQPPATPTVDPRLSAAGLPQVLRHYLPGSPGGLPWRAVLPGLRVIGLRLDASGPKARLIRFRPGFTVPRHDHGDLEYTVVLRGSYLDGDERYGPGDACIRRPGDQHELRVSSDEECIAVVSHRAPFIPLTPLGRLFDFLGRIAS